MSWAEFEVLYERAKEHLILGLLLLGGKLWELLQTPLRIFRKFCLFLGYCTFAMIMAVALFSYAFLQQLPSFEKSEFAALKRQASSRVESKLNDPESHYVWTPIDKINRDLLYAIVLSEDAKFFEHGGIDFNAVIDSFVINLKNREIVVGGSTISQQVVKNLYFSNEQSVRRKVKELIVTHRMEAELSKNEILEIYLNMAEFGPDIFGVAAASKAFFGKTPREINAAEGAFLSLMLPSPRKRHYAIFQNQNLNGRRRKHIDRVLSDMHNLEFISQRQLMLYKSYDFFEQKNTARMPASRR